MCATPPPPPPPRMGGKWSGDWLVVSSYQTTPINSDDYGFSLALMTQKRVYLQVAYIAWAVVNKL